MEPAAGLAGCRPWQQRPPPASLLPILGEAAQSWSNLRDSQSVAGMADPPKAPGAGPPPQPQLSPLSGAYLLIVVGEPFSEEHKKLILQKLQQGRKGSRTGREPVPGSLQSLSSLLPFLAGPRPAAAELQGVTPLGDWTHRAAHIDKNCRPAPIHVGRVWQQCILVATAS